MDKKVIKGIKKPVFKLHYHPDHIKENINEMLTLVEKDEDAKALFEDIKTLVDFAISKLKIR